MSTPQPARKRLPLNPSEENLRKQAKHRAKLDGVQLAEAQQRLATDYGCPNWAELISLVQAMRRGREVPLMSSEGKPNRPLPAAARAKDLDAVSRLLQAGQYTQEELDSSLAGALWYGDAKSLWPRMKETADLLLEYGADSNAFLTSYGPIVFGTGECQQPESLQYLIDAGADVTFGPVDTKYGRQCPLSYWLGSYARGDNTAKHRGIEILLRHNAFVPPEILPPILAIHCGAAKLLGELLDAEPALLQRRFPDLPYGNIELRGGTLLHCAVEFNEIDCAEELIKRDADINITADPIDGVGGQTPVYHAIHTFGDAGFQTLEYLVKRLGQRIDVNVRATWRGSAGWAIKNFDSTRTPLTPLEYAEIAAREVDPNQAQFYKHGAATVELLRSLGDGEQINPEC